MIPEAVISNLTGKFFETPVFPVFPESKKMTSVITGSAKKTISEMKIVSIFLLLL
jgi:hypothetical protein